MLAAHRSPAGSPAVIIQRHYKGLVKTSDAKEFWAVHPESLESKIITLPIKRAA